MTKYNELKQLYIITVNHLNNLDKDIQSQIKKIKEDTNSKIHEEKLKLLMDISNGENLDFNMLKEKYIKTKTKKEHEVIQHVAELTADNRSLDTDNNSEDIYTKNTVFSKITINSIDYYYTNDINGKIYDKNLNIAGTIINSVVTLN
jgi:hypothetical protein